MNSVVGEFVEPERHLNDPHPGVGYITSAALCSAKHPSPLHFGEGTQKFRNGGEIPLVVNLNRDHWVPRLFVDGKKLYVS